METKGGVPLNERNVKATADSKDQKMDADDHDAPTCYEDLAFNLKLNGVRFPNEEFSGRSTIRAPKTVSGRIANKLFSSFKKKKKRRNITGSLSLDQEELKHRLQQEKVKNQKLQREHDLLQVKYRKLTRSSHAQEKAISDLLSYSRNTSDENAEAHLKSLIVNRKTLLNLQNALHKLQDELLEKESEITTLKSKTQFSRYTELETRMNVFLRENKMLRKKMNKLGQEYDKMKSLVVLHQKKIKSLQFVKKRQDSLAASGQSGIIMELSNLRQQLRKEQEKNRQLMAQRTDSPQGEEHRVPLPASLSSQQPQQSKETRKHLSMLKRMLKAQTHKMEQVMAELQRSKINEQVLTKKLSTRTTIAANLKQRLKALENANSELSKANVTLKTQKAQKKKVGPSKSTSNTKTVRCLENDNEELKREINVLKKSLKYQTDRADILSLRMERKSISTPRMDSHECIPPKEIRTRENETNDIKRMNEQTIDNKTTKQQSCLSEGGNKVAIESSRTATEADTQLPEEPSKTSQGFKTDNVPVQASDRSADLAKEPDERRNHDIDEDSDEENEEDNLVKLSDAEVEFMYCMMTMGEPHNFEQGKCTRCGLSETVQNEMKQPEDKQGEKMEELENTKKHLKELKKVEFGNIESLVYCPARMGGTHEIRRDAAENIERCFLCGFERKMTSHGNAPEAKPALGESPLEIAVEREGRITCPSKMGGLHEASDEDEHRCKHCSFKSTVKLRKRLPDVSKIYSENSKETQVLSISKEPPQDNIAVKQKSSTSSEEPREQQGRSNSQNGIGRNSGNGNGINHHGGDQKSENEDRKQTEELPSIGTKPEMLNMRKPTSPSISKPEGNPTESSSNPPKAAEAHITDDDYVNDDDYVDDDYGDDYDDPKELEKETPTESRPKSSTPDIVENRESRNEDAIIPQDAFNDDYDDDDYGDDDFS